MVVSNGSFESGTFSNWRTIGDTSIETKEYGVSPTDGEFQALLTNGFSGSGGSVVEVDLQEFLDFPVSLDEVFDVDVIEGSAIKQTLSAEAGDILRIDFDFLTDETTFDNDPGTFNDFAFYTLVPEGEAPNADVLADTSALLFPSGTPFDTETEYLSIDILQSGTFTLGIGVVDVDDSGFDSGLLVDNIQIISPPSPPGEGERPLDRSSMSTVGVI